MRKTAYKKIIVIGYGKITGQILEEVGKKRAAYGYDVSYVEYEKEPFGITWEIGAALGIECHLMEDKKKLTDFFLDIHERCLIISASNNYLFPASLTENPRYTIVNFHNALLPKFPGRNAPSWAIYEKEKETGITWHYVTSRVDDGDIIVQKKCAIDSDIRAYELAARLMELAYEGFAEKFEEILEDRVKAQSQNTASHRKMYKSTECPGDGKFSIEDTPENIYRLMRATDYGKYRIFPPLTSEYQGKEIRVIRYRKIPAEEMSEKAGTINLPLRDGFWLKITYTELLGAGIEGGGMPDIDYLYELLSEIKKVNRKYASNCYLTRDVMSTLTEQDKLTYVYKKNEYLNLYLHSENFNRLYYFVADFRNYDLWADARFLVCDVVFRDGSKDVTCQMLQDAGMCKYSVYEKWVCDEPTFLKTEKFDDLCLVMDDCGDRFYEKIKANFDAYSDAVPNANEWRDFQERHRFIAIYDTDQNILAGGLVYLKKESMVLEEFVFVDSEYRGMGLGKQLHNALYRMYAFERMKYIAWIRINNIASMKLHSRYQYKRQKQMKATFIKNK